MTHDTRHSARLEGPAADDAFARTLRGFGPVGIAVLIIYYDLEVRIAPLVLG